MRDEVDPLDAIAYAFSIGAQHARDEVAEIVAEQARIEFDVENRKT